jgi:hypothetical protein
VTLKTTEECTGSILKVSAACTAMPSEQRVIARIILIGFIGGFLVWVFAIFGQLIREFGTASGKRCVVTGVHQFN